MTVHSEEGEGKSPPRRRSKRYIPNLAEFYFEPTYDWTIDEAKSLYEVRDGVSKEIELNTVFYEDCIQGMKKLPNGCADLVIADPPFGIDFNGKSSVYNRDERLVVEDYEEVNGSYAEFTNRWISELPRVLKDEGSVYIFSGWTNLEPVLSSAREVGLSTLNHIVWHYPFGVFTKRRFVTSHYHVLLLVKNPKSYFFNKIEHYPEDVWPVKRTYRAGEVKNSTKLPLEVVKRCIEFSSKPGDLILDPFMGNGTTAVAAKSSWRHFLGYEINERLKPVIDSEVSSIKLGECYTPYATRLPTIDELAEAYPNAYREFLRREKEEKR
ncbi:MAG: DNA methyltransferase [Candidatus Thorarchaeota archaeon]|jgi:site-specific DNA-methyltransferase (adenine-specific)